MRFSIIIPTFNRAHLAGQAIESALSQTYGGSEIIVVDDGSTDETGAAVAKYGEAVRYLRQENSGKAAALNLGMKSATGDVFVVLDDDDVFPPTAIAAHAKGLNENPAATFTYGKYTSFEGMAAPTPETPMTQHDYPLRDPRRLLVKLMEHCFLTNPSWAVRREAQEEAGPYNVALYRSQDFDMILRLARANPGAFVDETVFWQRTHSDWRGPLADRTFGVHTMGKWAKYNRIIFEGIDQTWQLSDFAPFDSGTAVDPELETSLAWLQRGVAMFVRKHYPGAENALREFRTVLGARRPSGLEVKIASELLASDMGVDELLDAGPERAAVVEMMRTNNWPMRMRMAFASSMRWRVRRALVSRELQVARNEVRFLAEAFGGPAAIAALCVRLEAGAQWQPLLARS
jgi:glycosyltransferase involved in cell wall biosynthesis